MDYNYVRMRNAQKSGDSQKTEYYRNLFEKGIEKKHNITIIDYIIAFLIIISLLLGVYILYTEYQMSSDSTATTQVTDKVDNEVTGP